MWETLHAAFHRPRTRVHRWVEAIVWLLIAASVVLLVLEPLVGAHPALYVLDRIILLAFAVELGLRVLTFVPPELRVFDYPPLARARRHLTGRLGYLLKPSQLVDLAAVIAVVPGLRGLRVLRTLRLLRSGRLFKHGNPFAGLMAAFERDRILFLFAFSVLGIETILGGLSLYLVEHTDPGASVKTPGQGLWWALVTLTTVGYGDYSPVTDLGRAIGAVLMVGGMVTLALFAGIVGHTLLNAVLSIREEQFRMSSYVDHIIVCGYEKGSTLLLDALGEELDLDEHQVVLFADGDRPADVPASFLWVQGDPSKESELDKVRLGHARAIIVVGRREVTPQLADANTILTIFTVRAYLHKHERDQRRSAPLHVVAEILDSENVAHARTAGADEVIESRRLGYSMISHTVRYPGAADAAATMVAAGDQNLYLGPLPGELAGQPFGEVARALRDQQSIMVIGYRDGASGQRRLNPDDAEAVPAGAQLVYLAESPRLA